jgi:hydrogenase-4 component F
VPLVIGLLISLGALFLRLNSIAFGEPSGSTAPDRMSPLPMMFHLGLVLMIGIFIPGPVVSWFQHIATLLG